MGCELLMQAQMLADDGAALTDCSTLVLPAIASMRQRARLGLTVVAPSNQFCRPYWGARVHASPCRPCLPAVVIMYLQSTPQLLNGLMSLASASAAGRDDTTIARLHACHSCARADASASQAIDAQGRDQQIEHRLLAQATMPLMHGQYLDHEQG